MPLHRLDVARRRKSERHSDRHLNSFLEVKLRELDQSIQVGMQVPLRGDGYCSCRFSFGDVADRMSAPNLLSQPSPIYICCFAVLHEAMRCFFTKLYAHIDNIPADMEYFGGLQSSDRGYSKASISVGGGGKSGVRMGVVMTNLNPGLK